jgi:predicted RecA/RadA family phage recombinase
MGMKFNDSDAIRHYNSTTGTIAAGTAVAVGTGFVGVASRDIPPLTTGTLALEGVYMFPKPTGAGTDYARGSKVSLYLGNMVTGATGVGAGWVEEQPTTTSAEVAVLLWPGC